MFLMSMLHRARDIHLTEIKKGFQNEARALPLPRTYGWN
jgi:hypothetical protein